MRKKLRRKAGESIAETLVSVLIIALCFLMLSGAVGAAARVNARVKNDEQSFASGGESGTLKVYLIMGDTSTEVDAALYENNGYIYYGK